MKDLLLDDGGGIDFASVVTDIDEIKQSARVLLETKLGEFFADESMGLDWTDLFEKNFNEQYAGQAIKSAIEQDERISVTSVTVVPDFNTRVVSVNVMMIANNTTIELGDVLDVG